MSKLPTRARECPKDWIPLVPEMRTTLLRKVQVDVCPKCRGLFLDKGEIKTLTGKSNLNRLLTKYLGRDSDSPLVCPHCGGLMDGEDAGGIRVEVCLTCFGVWLDSGELEKLQMVEDSELLHFTPEKVEELLRAEKSRANDRRRALRGLFRGLGRR